MTQTVVLAVGTTTAASSNITVGLTGVPVNVYIYSVAPLSNNVQLPLNMNGPGGTVIPIDNFSRLNPHITITAPGSYFVQRTVTQLDGIAVGVAIEQ